LNYAILLISRFELKKMAKISKNYKPTQKEKFMNAKMKEYFKQKLLNWKNELLKESSQTLNNLQSDNEAKPDITDRASEEIDRSFELRTRDRERKLINKINSALQRIEDGSYGYCEETGEPIGLKRLEARPVATLSLEAQEMHEKAEKRLN
jgi:DnaK suppressor protein